MSATKRLAKMLGGTWTYVRPGSWHCDDGRRHVARCAQSGSDEDNPGTAEFWLYGDGVPRRAEEYVCRSVRPRSLPFPLTDMERDDAPMARDRRDLLAEVDRLRARLEEATAEAASQTRRAQVAEDAAFHLAQRAPEPRRYERTWFRMNCLPQESEPEVFLAYSFADALAQSEHEAKRFGQETRLWRVRPHVPTL